MALEFKYSSYRVNNFAIAVVILLGLSAWFTYDGYRNADFIEKHTNAGVPDDTLKFNRGFWYGGVPAAIVCAGFFLALRGRKIVVDDNAIKINGKSIPLDAIESLDQSKFKDKGFFILHHGAGQSTKFSRNQWDGMNRLREFVIEKIS
ncbi:MAG: hypothetical protein AB7F23_02035 [Phycisphaerae bacterium]|jgi:hypothetical protein